MRCLGFESRLLDWSPGSEYLSFSLMLLVLLCPLPLLGITLVFSCGFAKKRMKIAVMFHTLHPESLCIERYHFLQSFIIAFSFQPQDDSNACIFFCKMRLCKF